MKGSERSAYLRKLTLLTVYICWREPAAANAEGVCVLLFVNPFQHAASCKVPMLVRRLLLCVRVGDRIEPPQIEEVSLRIQADSELRVFVPAAI